MSTSEKKQSGFVAKAAAVGIAVVAVLLIIGTWLVNQSAQQTTDEAVRSVSMLYLNELTGRREQVVETNLKNSIEDMQTAIGLMTPEDLSDEQHLQAYQAKMKQLYSLDKFAFVDENGLIYTSLGTQDNINEYDFDYRTISQPDISVKGIDSLEKKVVIAMPTNGLSFNGHTLVASFMEIDMQEMIEGLSLQSDANDTTFCNIYTSDGVSLTNMVLGGLASEDNLLDALATAQFETGSSFAKVQRDFQDGVAGVASFTYGGIQETLAYVPVTGTDWMLTYLIRESVISDRISDISDRITLHSTLQTALTAFVLFAVFVLMMLLMRRGSQLTLEKEMLEAESRVKQQEMEQRLALQEQLLEQERQRARQDKMITALGSDYRSVYYVDLDADEGICFQANERVEGGVKAGATFSYLERIRAYAERFVAEPYREGFLKFVDPESIRTQLKSQPVISFRYLATYGETETYEMVRMAGVRHPEDRGDDTVHAVGMAFADVDDETRDQMAQSQALNDALTVAEEASKAKTTFLSNMSHEIRTPMNAIIGLDSIALADPDLSPKTRERLERIGDSARHLLGLINDILDVSRIESGRMSLKSEAFSFSHLIEQVNTMISGQCADKGLNYRCLINGQVDDSYIGDGVKLRQVLVNLLGNAVKFTPEGGNVELSVQRTAHYEGRSTLRFTVSDTGIGMDEDFLPHMFETFAQEDSSAASPYGSTGLGLAITKSIVELMHGSIDVTSKKGEGTTFYVAVTLTDDEDKRTGGINEEIRPRDLTVLVVDDDPVACEHAKLVLENVGITTQVAESGPEAIEAVRLRQARREPFDLILVDWKMPDMDGVETTRRIRAIAGVETAIVILTAYNWDDVLEEAVSAGVDGFIAKPLFAANVLEEFQAAYRKKRVQTTKAEHKAELEGRRILLAEDVLLNAEIIRELLAMRGIQVDHAENGKIAVDMFAEHEPGYYDAVLMDMRMAVMNGLTATMTIRAMEREDAKVIPIIALTANAFDEDVQQSLQAGLNAHLSKPVEPESLFETLESLIRD